MPAAEYNSVVETTTPNIVLEVVQDSTTAYEAPRKVFKDNVIAVEPTTISYSSSKY